MKISELNNKSFLGAPGAATHSYVLVNYEDNTTNEPVTYKATLDELGKSIASNLSLLREDGGYNMSTIIAKNGAYEDGYSHYIVDNSTAQNIKELPKDIARFVQNIIASEGCVFCVEDKLQDVDGNYIPYLLTVDPSTNGLYYFDKNGYETTYGKPVMNARPVYAVFGPVENGEAECRLISTIDKDTVVTLSTFTVNIEDSTVQPSESGD